MVRGREEVAGAAGDPIDLADVAARRSGTWWLLSRLVTEAPDAAWLGELEAALGAAVLEPEAALQPEAAALLAALHAARAQADGPIGLAVDRTRLLGGVIRNEAIPAPYETVAMGDEMNAARVMAVADAYAEAGFDDLARRSGPPDALGTELRFMSLLCFREMEARRGGDPASAAAWLARQQRFMDEHVMVWVPAHCDRIAMHAETPFYAAAARLLVQACRIDRDDIARLMEPAVIRAPAGPAA